MRKGQTGQAKLTWRERLKPANENRNGLVPGHPIFIARDDEGMGPGLWRVAPYITKKAAIEAWSAGSFFPAISHWTVERWAFAGEGFSGGTRSTPGWERFPTPGHCDRAEDAMAIAEKGCC